MRCRIRQWFAGFLSVVMLISMLPVTAYAEGGGSPEKTAIEQIQELIDALPNAEEITADSRTAVREQIDAIEAALSELDGEETAKLDAARYEAALSALSTLDSAAGAETENNGADTNNRKGTTPVSESNETGSDTVTGGDLHTGTVAKRVQSMIDALPDAETVTADNRADVEAQLTAIDEAKLALSQEELDALDITRYNNVVLALLALEGLSGVNQIALSATDHNMANGSLTISADGSYTVTGTTTSNTILVKNNAQVTITLNNVSVTSSGCAFDIQSGNVTLILADGTTNSFTSNNYYAGIHVAEGASLTIDGTGTLNAVSKQVTGVSAPFDKTLGAGIGGNGGTDVISTEDNAGSILIKGGTVNAKCEGDGAGIGGGWTWEEHKAHGSFQSITITGGKVTAESGGNGAGIGCGCWAAEMGTININGGEVHAKSASPNGVSYAIGYAHKDKEFESNISVEGGVIFTEGPNGRGIGAESLTKKNCLIVSESSSVEINGNPTITGDVTLPDGKTLTIPSGSTLTVAEGAMLTVAKGANLTVAAGATLTVETNAELTVAEGATLTNNNKIVNHGKIVQDGTINGSGTMEGNPAAVYKLSVTAPVLASATEGYSQPEAQPITIQNTGTMEAAISKVTVSGSEFTISEDGGSDHTVAVGGTNTNWKIQPRTGLMTGIHTATVTVTYDGGKTATAQVSFVVKYAEDVLLDVSKRSLRFDSDGRYTVTGTTSANTITVTGGNVELVLDSVSITSGACAFDIQGGKVTLILADGTTNSFTSGGGNAGIQVAENAYLTIKGNGALNATAKKPSNTSSGAGIGGHSAKTAGHITIESGTITAKSESSCDGAGIGGGHTSEKGQGGGFQSITITGGKVTAESGGNGAGIGGGCWCKNMGTITISGGEIHAKTNGTNNSVTTGNKSFAIGYGYGSSKGGTITITGGLIFAESKYGRYIGAASAPTPTNCVVFKNDSGVDFNGNPTITGNVTLSKNLTIPSGHTLTVADGATLTVAKGTTLTVSEGAQLTVKENGTLIVEGTLTNNNTIQNDGTINQLGTIDGSGTINGKQPGKYGLSVAVSNFASASEGYSVSEVQPITIRNTGTMEVTISDVTVSGHDFTISKDEGSDNTVAVGGTNTSWKIQPQPGLAAGNHTATVTVTYNGGKPATTQVSFAVTYAPGDTLDVSKRSLLFDSDCQHTIIGTTTANTITVTKGNVELVLDSVSVTSGKCAFDIKGGNVTLILKDGTTNSFISGGHYAGIHVAEGATLTIKGNGTLNATAKKPGDTISGAGIGGNYDDNAGSITIESGTVVAKSEGDGAGIGGGHANDNADHKYGQFKSITINGGKVTAESGGNGAGIGCGCWAKAMGPININGGEIHAKTASTKAYDIGYGYKNDGDEFDSTITIKGGVIFTEGTRNRGIGAKSSTKEDCLIVPYSGNVECCGDPTITGDITIPSGKTLTVPAEQTLTVAEGATLTIVEGATLTVENEGTIVNNGRIIIYGTINGRDKVTEHSAEVYCLQVTVPTFGNLVEGYPQQEAKTVTIRNTGTVAANVSEVKLSGNGFDLNTGTTGKLESGASNTTWTIRPRSGLTDGLYTATLTVAYDGGKKETVQISLQVVNEPISYLDSDGSKKECKSWKTVVSNETDWNESNGYGGWYGLDRNVTFSYRIYVEGNVKLILKDGCTLSTRGITIRYGSTLTIYAQSADADTMGALSAQNVYDECAGIGGEPDWEGKAGAGNIVICGGKITAVGGKKAAGIGGGENGYGGHITIYGGVVTATGSNGGAGIGGGYGSGGRGGYITIYGGTVTATGSGGGAGIGGGCSGDAQSTEGVTIYGGTVTATGSNGGAGIGAGTSGKSGKFSTGENGDAVIHANGGISNKENQSSWSGVIFEEGNGQVYGDPIPTEDFEVGSGETLTVPGGKTLTVADGVTLTNSGAVNIESGGHVYKEERGTITGNSFKWEAPPYQLSVANITFDDAQYGYAPLSGQTITITNTGSGSYNPVIKSVTLDGDGFTLGKGNCGQVEKGTPDESWSIRPDSNLSVGKYTASIIVTYGESGSGVTKTATAEVSFTVTKAKPTVTVEASSADGELNYGDDITLTATVSADGVDAKDITGEVAFQAGGVSLGTVPLQTAASSGATLIISGSDRKTQKVLFGDSSDTSVTLTASYNGNDSIGEQTKTADVTVKPKELTFSFTPKNKTYDGEASVEGDFGDFSGQLLAEEGTTDEVTIKSYAASAGDADAGTGKSVTVTEITLDGADAKYYTPGRLPDAVACGTVDIARAAACVTGEPVGATDLCYTGASQELLTTGALCTGGTMKYFVGEKDDASRPGAEAEWKEDIADITATETGTYTVWYKVEGDGNHISTEPASLSVAIGKADTSVTVTAALASAGEGALTYGEDITLTATVDSDNIDKSCAEKITGEVEFKIGETSLGTAPLQTATATLTISGSDREKQHALFGEDGSTTLTASYGGDANCNESANGSETITMAKRDLLYTVTAQDREYVPDNDVVAVTLTPDTPVKGEDLTLTAIGRVEKADTGIYDTISLSDITLTGEDGKYYNSVAETATVKVTVEIRKIRARVDTPPVGASDLIYTGASQKLLAAGAVSTGGVLQYLVGEKDDPSLPAEDAEWKEDIASVTATEAGTYTVWYRAYEDPDYTTSETGSVTVVLEKAPAQVDTEPVGAADLAYTGKPRELLSAEAVSTGGALQYFVGEKDDPSLPAADAEWKEDIADVTATEAGTYTVWYKVTGDENHKDTEPASLTVSIEKASGRASVSLENYLCGDTDTLPVPQSETNGTEKVTYFYKEKDAQEDAYRAERPLVAGEYTVKAVFEETANYRETVATADFSVTHRFDTGWNVGADGVYQTCPCHTDFRLTQNGILEVPEALRENETLNTPEKIVRTLREEAVEKASVPEQNTVVYDVTLQIKDSGSGWTEMTDESLPAEGIEVTLPYPEGTDARYTFTVIHMITTGKSAGQTEIPEVTNTEQGICFTVKSLSPFCISWTAPKQETPPEKADGGKADDQKADGGKADDQKADGGKADDQKTDDGKVDDQKTDDEADNEDTDDEDADMEDALTQVQGGILPAGGAVRGSQASRAGVRTQESPSGEESLPSAQPEGDGSTVRTPENGETGGEELLIPSGVSEENDRTEESDRVKESGLTGFWPWILLLVVLLASGAGAYVLFLGKKRHKDEKGA